jgi:hypothetical protein
MIKDEPVSSFMAVLTQSGQTDLVWTWLAKVKLVKKLGRFTLLFEHDSLGKSESC